MGSACWMLAPAVLDKRGGADGYGLWLLRRNPIQKQQHYHEAVALVGADQLDSIYMRLFNPHLQQWFFTDPAYMWYRNCFLEMVAEADCVAYNRREGGTHYGKPIEFVPLASF